MGRLCFFQSILFTLFCFPNFNNNKMIQQFLFLALSTLVLCYNTLHVFLSNRPIEFQKTIITYSFILLSIYLPLYFLKVFHFNTIKFFAYWGGILFLLLPYLLFNIFPIYVLPLTLSSSLVIAVPIVYGCSMIYFYMSSLYKEYSNLTILYSKIEIATVFISLVTWSLLPIIMHLGISNLLENIIVNSCFILSVYLLLKKNAVVSKKKFADLQILLDSTEKENTLQEDFNFTTREKEIISYLAKGLTYKEIGEVLFISDRTVGKHVSNIYAKTGVNQKYELLEKLKIISVLGTSC